jgi:hypothetical protein
MGHNTVAVAALFITSDRNLDVMSTTDSAASITMGDCKLHDVRKRSAFAVHGWSR